MAREHMPIQIGLPAEPAWQLAELEPTTFLAFLAGDELPDPGDAFLAAQRAFGVEPESAEPLPVTDEGVAWAFSFRIPRREHFVAVWCERAGPGASPDGLAPNARWAIAVQSILATEPHAQGLVPPPAVADAVALAATAAGVGTARTELLYDAEQRAAYLPEDFREIFLGESTPELGRCALADESLLFRVELVARDAANGPYWLHTAGLARLGRPELELVEIPASLVAPAVALLEALAGRFVGDEPPHAGVPFEAGSGVAVALVPAAEAIETLAAGAPGGAEDRARRGLRGPRAVVCAAGRRGAFRAVWMPPLEELARLSSGDAALELPPSSVVVTERRARLHWARFIDASRGARPLSARFEVKLGRTRDGGGAASAEPLEHRWHDFVSGDEHGGIARAPATEPGSGADAREFAFTLAEVTDWRVFDLREDVREIGPGSSRLLRRA